MPDETVFRLNQIPARFWPAVDRVQRLRAVERYQAAYIFGSVARGQAKATSDLDVHVLVDQENSCININHPVIAGVKLDVTFLSLEQMTARTQREIEKGNRIPMVAESLIIFDKTGELTDLRAAAQQACPIPCLPADHQAIQFIIFHANDKAERMLTSDPLGALLVMHTSLVDVLNTYYRIQSRWRVSDKRLLADLREWAPVLAGMVERLIVTADVQAKFAIWSEIVDYVVALLGGRQPIAENNCACAVCQGDLSMLSSA
jgi:predicted nucleotidyltransferase